MVFRKAKLEDKESYLFLDKHLNNNQYEIKLNLGELFVLEQEEKIVGVLRYSLFWDSIPFCNLLYISDEKQKQGYGTALLRYWENQMRNLGYKMVLTSTQIDETAKFFYEKLGYVNSGYLVITNEFLKQPKELFYVKDL